MMSNHQVPAAAEGMPIHPDPKLRLGDLIHDAVMFAKVAQTMVEDSIRPAKAEFCGVEALRLFPWEWELLEFTIRQAKNAVDAVRDHAEAMQ